MGGEAGRQRRVARHAERTGNTEGQTWWEDLFDDENRPGGANAPGGTGGMPDYQAEMDEAERIAEERTQGVRDRITGIDAMADDIPSFTEWMEQNGYALNTAEDEYAGMQELIDRLSAGPTDADDDAAFEHAARMMGLSAEEAHSILGGLTKRMAGYVEGMTEEEMAEAGVLSGFQGMTPEEMALRQRQNQSNLRMAEERARRMVQDTFADSGSTARMFQAADSATMQINNMQIQQDSALAQEDFERSLAEFESVKATQQTMVETNQIGTKQYIDSLQQGMSMAIEGYSRKIDLILKQNQEYFQQHRADLDALELQINTLYQAAHLELGVIQAELELAQSYYNTSLQPYWDSLQAQAIEAEMGFDVGGFMFGALTAAAGLALMLIPGGQVTGAGMIVGGGATALDAF